MKQHGVKFRRRSTRVVQRILRNCLFRTGYLVIARSPDPPAPILTTASLAEHHLSPGGLPSLA